MPGIFVVTADTETNATVMDGLMDYDERALFCLLR